jgi:hypothetical protein
VTTFPLSGGICLSESDMPKFLGRYALVVTTFVALGPAAFTAPGPKTSKVVPDQSDTVLSSGINVTDPAYAWQQSITPAVTGRLVEIDLWGMTESGYPTTGATQLTLSAGAPWQDGAPAWSQLVTLKAGWNTIKLTPAKFAVVAGQPFTVGLHCPASSCPAPFVGFSYNDVYLGGGLYLNGVDEFLGHDLMFRTWVQP